MGILHEWSARTMISELRGRGLDLEEIDKAMQEIVGPDWKDVHVIVWHKRLQEQKLIAHDDRARFIDDLEALVSGRNVLNAFYKKDHRSGRA